MRLMSKSFYVTDFMLVGQNLENVVIARSVDKTLFKIDEIL